MANLTITAADVAPVKVIEQYTAPNGESLTKGMYGRYSSAGKFEKGKATTAGEVGFGGIVISDDGAQTVTVMRKGIVDLGEALASLAYGAAVYLSDTDATLADAAGTVSTIVGHVIAGWGATSADKLLSVDVEN